MATKTDHEVSAGILGSVKVILFTILLLVSSIHIVLQVMTVSLLLALLVPRWPSSMNSYVVNLWHWYTVTLCEHLLGVKVVVSGTPPRNNRPTLIVMNHRTRLDWLFYFCCHARYAYLGHLRVCLKEVLKHMPGAGWGIQLLVFLFVRRRWENDELVLKRCIRYYFNVGLKPEILLFPEGTDLTSTSKERSDRFAMENKFPKYSYLLHPRTRGFTFAAQKLNEYFEQIDIVDITVAYPYNVCQGENHLLLGNIPKEVHFHMETIPARSVPREQAHLEELCRNLWRKKERLLEHFHLNKHFPQEASNSFRSDLRFSLTKLAVFVMWIVHTVLSTLILYYSRVTQVYYLCGLCLYTFSVIGFSGLDVVIPHLELHNKRFFFASKPRN